jgi:hypothetical protein
MFKHLSSEDFYQRLNPEPQLMLHALLNLPLVFLLTTLPDADLPALVSFSIMHERLAKNLSPHKYDRLIGLPSEICESESERE